MNVIGQELASSLTGNIQKAILYVRQTASGAADMVSGAAGAGNAILQNTANALNGTRTSAASAAGALTGASLTTNGMVKLEVQFNPASISMRTQAGKQVDFNGGSMNNSMTMQNIEDASTTMSFQLIFDQVNVYDAFMMSNLNLTAGNVYQGAKNLLNKSGYSVQNQVDGIVSLLTMAETRQVAFEWATQYFQGELVAVNAEYTMFNKSGNPIRGVVHLTIRQSEADMTMDAWNATLNQLFAQSAANSTAGKVAKATQNNLLNLNI